MYCRCNSSSSSIILLIHAFVFEEICSKVFNRVGWSEKHEQKKITPVDHRTM